ncbi:MAG: hypothetical protein ACRD4U_05005 [Candidatus Acidiferrales bacterium]
MEATLRVLRRAKADLAVTQMRAQASRQGLDRLPMAGIDKEIRAARRARQR